MPKSFEIAEKIFLENHGILRASHARQLGIDQKTLKRMLEADLLTKEARGVYRLADFEPLSDPDLIQVSLRIPSGVICLISALYFHNLTTQIPHYIYTALPKDVKAPQVDYPPLRIFHFSGKSYSAGIEEHHLDGVPVRIYSREKTVADCFKFRNKIGVDIALEALKDYLRQPNWNIPRLLEYARVDRIETILQPYLRAAL